MKLGNVLAGLVCGVLAAAPAHAQGLGSTGLTGQVVDVAGARVVRALVLVSSSSGAGFVRRAVTTPSGEFAFEGLPAGTYTVEVAAAGRPTARRVVDVQRGRTARVSYRLLAAAAPVVVHPETAPAVTVINSEMLAELPVDRRDYLSLALLVPGAADARRGAGGADNRRVQLPTSGLSFYGDNGRGNTLLVNGNEYNDGNGGVRINVSQEAVEEIAIDPNVYGAANGAARSGLVSVMTRSGSNDLSASGFGFFRAKALNAEDPFTQTSALASGATFNPAAADKTGAVIKPDFSRQMFGGSVGGRLSPDKAFVFGAYEHLSESSQRSFNVLPSTSIFRPTAGQQTIITQLAALGAVPVPCLTGQPALPAATCAGILQNILTVNPASAPLSAFVVNQFTANAGLQAFDTMRDVGSFRFDHVIGTSNRAGASYAFGRDNEPGATPQALSGFSRGATSHEQSHTGQAWWTTNLGAHMANALRAQFSRDTYDWRPNSAGQVGLEIAGFGSFGRDFELPSSGTLNRIDVSDTWSVSAGSNDLRVGGSWTERRTTAFPDTMFAGRFVFGTLPGGVLSPCLQVPAACGLFTGPATIDAIQNLSLGLPAFYQQGFFTLTPSTPPSVQVTAPLYAAFVQDVWHSSRLTLDAGVRYEIDKHPAPVPRDSNNFAPRMSVAFDPNRDGTLILHGGWGVFYGSLPTQVDVLLQQFGAEIADPHITSLYVPLTGLPGNPALTSAAIFQTLFAQGKVSCTTPAAGNNACIAPSDLTQFGLSTSSVAFPVQYGIASGFQNPQSQRIEGGVSQELAGGVMLDLAGVWMRTTHVTRVADANLLAAPTATSTLANGSTVTYHNWGAASCSASPSSCFANAVVLQNNVFTSDGQADYHAFIARLQKRFSHGTSVLASYTWSRATDNVSDFPPDYAPFDATNLAGEVAPSDFDQRHQLVVAGVFETPGQLVLAPVFRFTSGHPFNLLAGSDVNGDRQIANDRPLGAGRNTGLGPNYASLDLRVAKKFGSASKGHVEAIFEVYNLLNRTNYAAVNNLVGSTFGQAGPTGGGQTSFNVTGVAGIAANQPLGYTGAYGMRAMQIGVRVGY